MNRWSNAWEADTLKGRCRIFYRSFKVLTVNTATVLKVTRCCWYAWATSRVLKALSLCSWLKASSAEGSGYADFWDAVFTVQR